MPEKKTRKERLREHLMAAMVEATLDGHNLSPFTKVESGTGYQANCRQCLGLIYVSHFRIYNALANPCPLHDVGPDFSDLFP